VGSITDETLLKEACRGVDSVLHIAGVADSTMFPDADRIQQVNVQGRTQSSINVIDVFSQLS